MQMNTIPFKQPTDTTNLPANTKDATFELPEHC